MRYLTATALLASLLGGPVSASELTPDYLVGEWCFASFDDQGKKQPNNQNWEFRADGTFLSQLSEYSGKTRKTGNWTVEGDKLKIHPGYMDTFMPVEIVSNDEFVLKWLVNMYLKRGKCPDEPAE